jgi:transposase-like protein
MERPQFERVKAQVAAATAGQTLELEEIIQHVIAQQFTEMALARRTRQTLRTRTCPRCKDNNIVLHGKDQNGRQRFKCRGCCRSYNIMTGTPMARARKPEKWAQYLACMTDHMSVRKIVASGIGIHHVTAWRWRHRFLQAPANDNASVLSGVIEANETFFPRSFKGSRGWTAGKPPAGRDARTRAWATTKSRMSHEQVPVLTALDNSGGVFQAILASRTEIERVLQGRIAAGSVLCSDGSAAYVSVADKARAEHYTIFVSIPPPRAGKTKPVAAPARQPGRLGLARVNSHHQNLKYLVNERCRGVATRYLSNYLGWHRAIIRPGFEGKTLLAQALV